MPGMAIALSIFGVAFAAFCVWLTVRIVNRREKWAKWTLAAAVGLPVLYVASFGPACWWLLKEDENQQPPSTQTFKRAPAVYEPIAWLYRRAPGSLADAFHAYIKLGLSDDDFIWIPDTDGGACWYRLPSR
jgi:hypothetical protein